MGKGFHLRNEHITVDIDGLGLLGKDHRNAKLLGNKGRNTNAGGLNGQHLIHPLVAKTALKLPSNFFHQRNIHLVIQKAIHLQHITGFDDTILYDSLF